MSRVDALIYDGENEGGRCQICTAMSSWPRNDRLERIGVGLASADRARFACFTSKGPTFSARNLPKELARNFKKYRKLAIGILAEKVGPLEVHVTCQLRVPP